MSFLSRKLVNISRKNFYDWPYLSIQQIFIFKYEGNKHMAKSELKIKPS